MFRRDLCALGFPGDLLYLKAHLLEHCMLKVGFVVAKDLQQYVTKLREYLEFTPDFSLQIQLNLEDGKVYAKNQKGRALIAVK